MRCCASGQTVYSSGYNFFQGNWRYHRPWSLVSSTPPDFQALGIHTANRCVVPRFYLGVFMANMDKMTARAGRRWTRGLWRIRAGLMSPLIRIYWIIYGGLRARARVSRAICRYERRSRPWRLWMRWMSWGSGCACQSVIGKDRPLAFRSWRFGGALVDGAFGAAVPAKGADVSP